MSTPVSPSDATPTTPPTDDELAAARAAAQRAYDAVENLKRVPPPIPQMKIRRALAECSPLTSVMSPLFVLRLLNAVQAERAPRGEP